MPRWSPTMTPSGYKRKSGSTTGWRVFWRQTLLFITNVIESETSRLRLFWAKLTGPNAFRQWRWALVPGMALALVIGSFMAGRVSVRRAPQVTAEVQRSPVTIIPPRTVVEQSASEKEPTGKSQGSLTAQIPPKPAQGGTIASSAPRRIGPPSTSPTAPEGGVHPTETAVLAPPTPSNPEKTPISSPPEPLQAPPGESASVTPTSPSVRGTRTVETAASGRPCLDLLQSFLRASRTVPSKPRRLLSRPLR